ncbi:hypothetical protein ABK040_005358 [Willaertia magna]
MSGKGSMKKEDSSKSLSQSTSTTALSTTSNNSKYKNLSDEDILKLVPEILFQDLQQEEEKPEFDLVEYLLQRETTNLDDEQTVLQELQKHEKVLEVVNGRLCKTVMNNYNSFVEGMTNVQEIGTDLKLTSILCKNGRKRLKKAQDNLVKGGLLIVAKYRKKKSLKNLDYYLNRIKDVVDTDKEMNQLLEEGNFPAAIKLMLQHRQAVVNLNQFYCIQQLDKSIKSLYQRMEQKMKDSLLSVCAQFDSILYERILIASKELATGEISSEIKKNYNEAIDQLLREVVLSFVLQNPKQQNIENVFKMDFQTLCKKIHFDHVLVCLLRALSTVSDIMYNYYHMYLWHEKEETEVKQQYDFSVTRLSINQFRKTLWDNIQRKISIILKEADLSHFKIDKFLQIFHAMNMLCQLGEEFSESDSYQLQRSVKAKSGSYFVHYHKEILDNFRTMIENEYWHQLDCLGFNLSDVPEFRLSKTNTSSTVDIGNIYEEYSKRVRGFLKSNDRDSNPFKIAFEKGSFQMTTDNEEEDKKEQVESSDEESSDEEEDDEETHKKVNSPTKNVKKTKRNSEVYTNVSLTMIRRMGVYIQAMEVLQPICLDVFFAFTTLYKFYLYTVHSLFANISPNVASSSTINLEDDFQGAENDSRVSESLQKTFKTIKEELNKCSKEASNSEVNFKPAKLSQMLNIRQPPLFGLYERIVAVESLTYLYDAIEKIIESRLESLIPKNKRHYATQFLKTMKSATDEVKDCIYNRTVKYLLFDFQQMEKYPDKIANCKFQINVLGDQCNRYVWDLKDDLKKYFSIKLQTIDDRLPSYSVNSLWDCAIIYVMDLLVEGFSRVKKCNNEGRVLMQLDLQTLTTEIQKMVPHSYIEEKQSNIPNSAIVRSYIQAYYQPSETDLLEWVKKNVHNFSVKQLVAVTNLGIGQNLKKNDLKQLVSTVEQLATSLKMQKEHIELMENTADDSLMNQYTNDTDSTTSNNSNVVTTNNNNNTSNNNGTSSTNGGNNTPTSNSIFSRTANVFTGNSNNNNNNNTNGSTNNATSTSGVSNSTTTGSGILNKNVNNSATTTTGFTKSTSSTSISSINSNNTSTTPHKEPPKENATFSSFANAFRHPSFSTAKELFSLSKSTSSTNIASHANNNSQTTPRSSIDEPRTSISSSTSTGSTNNNITSSTTTNNSSNSGHSEILNSPQKTMRGLLQGINVKDFLKRKDTTQQ